MTYNCVRTLRIALYCALALINASAYATPPLTSPIRAVDPSGALPDGSLFEGRDGNFYGTTSEGGRANVGTVFKVTPRGVLTTLYSFSDDSSGTNSDGAYPKTALVEGRDGNFYGTTMQGGLAGRGTIFKVTPRGKFTTLHCFTNLGTGYKNNDGAVPSAIILGNDGNFYGTTQMGGSYGDGTVFTITPASALTILVNFTGKNGANPYAGLVQSKDGNFYGTAYSADNSGRGTLFEMSPSGRLNTRVNFNGASTGSYPGDIVQGHDGRIYGTTGSGGVKGQGTIFQVTSMGELVTVEDFDNHVTGSYCRAKLVQVHDGNFYGTTSIGAAKKCGAVFKITPTGKLTLLHIFSPLSSKFPFSNADGAYPHAGLVEGRDENLYGATSMGGSHGYGTVFKINPKGTLTTIVNFAGQK